MKRHLIGIYFLACTSLWAQHTSTIAEAMDNYDYETAIRLIDNQPPTVDLLFKKAKAQKGLYRYNDAVASLKAINTEAPGNPSILLELAECCRLAGNLNEALSYYNDVITIQPFHKYARIQYINLLFSVDKYRQAKPLCEDFLKTDSTNLTLRLMAQCYEGLQIADSAIVYYTAALKAEPADFFSVTRLGNIYIEQDPGMTVSLTEDYRKLDSLNLYVNRLNAQAHCLAKNYTQAIERYEHLMSIGDTTRYNTMYLGMSYFAKELFYEAHDYLELAIKYDPKNVNILYYLARACASTSWKEEGIEYMKQAIEISTPTDENMGKLYAGLGECFFRAGQLNNYIEALQTQRKYEPRKSVILYRIGAVYMDQLKDLKNAERYLKMYVATKPKEMSDNDSAMEDGSVVIGLSATYRAAEARLDAIREENFYMGIQ